jgi:hypothetical protein
MFIGHYGVGLAAKRFAPRAQLGVLIAAATLLDLLWPLFLLTGVERVRIDPGNTVVTPLDFAYYPFSHGLLPTFGWATAFAWLYQRRVRYVPRTIVVWLAVVSHWFLDALVHRPDLPLYPGSRTVVGLGLWNSWSGTLVVEGAVFFLGVMLYARETRSVDGIGIYGFWAFVAILVVLYSGSLLGPPPPSSNLIAISDLGACLLLALAWWFDRHRQTTR